MYAGRWSPARCARAARGMLEGTREQMDGGLFLESGTRGDPGGAGGKTGGELLLAWWEGGPQRYVSHNIETPPERSLLVPKSAA
jgi:hypothetical protein